MSPPTEDPAPAKKRCQCLRGRRAAQASPVPLFGWAAITHSGQDRQRQRGAQGDCQSSKAFLIRGGHVPKHRLFRPISIAAATWPRVADVPSWLSSAVENAAGHRIRVDFKTLSSTNSGFATLAVGANEWKMRIAIHDGLDGPSRFGVLCHELAHILLGHLGTDWDQWWPGRLNLS